jgi:hypothetical protein
MSETGALWRTGMWLYLVQHRASKKGRRVSAAGLPDNGRRLAEHVETFLKIASNVVD